MSSHLEIQDLPLWGKLAAKRAPLSFELEITARCNNDCRHCYINLPAGDRVAQAAELSVEEFLGIAGQAVELGALWCLITGGEPLLREDFPDIYLGLKRLGLLVSVFTNACLMTPAYVALFRQYPPRDVEVSVYGSRRETYERVTRRCGSWQAFVRGLDLFRDAGIQARFKAMALGSNVEELDDISRFCRERTKDYYRFDPLLHLRFDRDQARNEEIKAERLSPAQVVAIEQADEQRFGALQRGCEDSSLICPDSERRQCNHLFRCGAGTGSFTVGYDGTFRLCSSLWHPGTTYDLRRGSLREAWEEHVPRVRDLRGTNPEFLDKCGRCSLVNLCLWCPAHAALETGSLDSWVDYFCDVAHARAAALRQDGAETHAPVVPTG